MYLIRTCFLIICCCTTLTDVSGANILFFNQDCNGLLGTDPCDNERLNLLNIITADGHNITLLDSLDHPDLAALLAANDFLLIPELEASSCRASNTSFIGTADSTILRNYVQNGGSIFTAGGVENVNLLNKLFAFALAPPDNATMGTSTLNPTDAAGTIFETCDLSIPNISVTFLLTSSMPASKKCIYQDMAGRTSVALFNVGSGYVVYLGYEFNKAGPGCPQAATVWTGCLIDSGIAAATFGPTGIPPSTIPTLSEWGMILLSISLSILGVLGLKTRVLSV